MHTKHKNIGRPNNIDGLVSIENYYYGWFSLIVIFQKGNKVNKKKQTVR